MAMRPFPGTARSSLLRPRKISNAVRRRVFERRLAHIPVDAYEPLIHLGSDYGGWVVPDDLIDAGWTCYSVGVGHDISFDLELIARYGVRVRAFDPFELFGEMALSQTAGDPRFSFHPYAVAHRDGPLEMFGRQDHERGAVSAAGLFDTGSAFTRPGRTIPSLMRVLGDRHVELLKLDVEGSEYDVIPSLDLRALGVRVFLTEFHHTSPAGLARAVIGQLEREGYRAVHRKDPTSFTFVRT
ncbi:MAG: FkbM family methyltransferase [Solirubrobacterales bacterium]|nr:FkbM family methyltransferase [Solirubrobacterales bacterium]